MDNNGIQSFKDLLCQKIMLYNDLVDCFQKERKSLMDINLDQLWEISREKEKTCSRVKTIQEKIISSLKQDLDRKSYNLNDILELIPEKDRIEFHRLYIALAKVKKEVEELRKANMIYINDSLQFLDDMISIITGESKSRMMYNEQCQLSKSAGMKLLSREV